MGRGSRDLESPWRCNTRNFFNSRVAGLVMSDHSCTAMQHGINSTSRRLIQKWTRALVFLHDVSRIPCDLARLTLHHYHLQCLIMKTTDVPMSRYFEDTQTNSVKE